MEKVKILHCADIHFDTPFKEFRNKLADKSKEEIKEVFSNIIKICNEENVDIMLLAGDIFDNYTLNKSTLIFIQEELKRLKRTKVFISPGNHDPYNFKSFYKLVDWPENVHVFKSSLEKVFIKELKTNIYGAAFEDNYVGQSMLKNIEVDKNFINIAVIHGELSNQGTTNEYNPITIKDIEESKLDYIALGHRHKFNGVQKVGTTSYAYSGCPQGRGFDELGAKGILIGYVGKGYVDLNFKKTCKREYIEKDVNIESAFGYREIKRKILEELKDFDLKINIFKVNLVGEIDASFKINEKILKEKLESEFYFVKIKDKTKIKIKIDDIENEHSTKGIFVKKISNKISEASGEELEILELALKIGLQSLTEDEVNLDDY